MQVKPNPMRINTRSSLFNFRLPPICAALLSAVVCAPAAALDMDSITAINHFNANCVRHLAKPDEVRAWADARYRPVRDPETLATVVGQTTMGSAWHLPTRTGRNITLSLRGDGRTCAVWSEAGDPEGVEEEFRKMVEGAAGDSVTVKTTTDSTLPTRSGNGRLLSMVVLDEEKGSGYMFTYIAGDLFSGAPIALSLQVVRVDDADK